MFTCFNFTLLFKLTNSEILCERQCLPHAQNLSGRDKSPYVADHWRVGVRSAEIRSTNFVVTRHVNRDILWRVWGTHGSDITKFDTTDCVQSFLQTVRSV